MRWSCRWTRSHRSRLSNTPRELPNGRAMVGQSHDYKRNGTTTLFAALDGTGEVTGQHHKRRRRVEFLAFMNRLVAQRGQGNPCDPGQPLDTQAEAGHVAEATSQHTLPLYPDTRLMVMLFRLDQERGPSETPQTVFRGPVILGTSPFPGQAQPGRPESAPSLRPTRAFVRRASGGQH
jgi:hypothetical protein